MEKQPKRIRGNTVQSRILSFVIFLTSHKHFPGPWEPRHVYVFTFSLIPLLLHSPILSHCLGGGVITQ